MDLNRSLQWHPVTCRRCRRSYACTPEDDYYGFPVGSPLPGPADGVCFSCLLILNGRNPDTTPVCVIGTDGRELDPRDLARPGSGEGTPC